MKIVNLMPTRSWLLVPKRLDQFEIESKTWWQRLLVWLLLRTGLTVIERVEDVQYKQITIDEQRIIDELLKLNHGIRRIYNGEIERIVCGPEAFQMMIRDAFSSKWVNTSFVAEFNLHGDDGPKLIGIPIQIVGWIEGFALIPKIDNN